MQCSSGIARAFATAAFMTTSLLLGAPAAVAQSPEFSVNATLTSDYRFRGFTQTRERPALQGGLDVVWPHFYMGLWASSVDFGDFGGSNIADIEVVPYVGIKRDILGYKADLRAIYYAYPGSLGAADLDYFEAMVGLSREWMPGLTLTSKVYYSPDYQGGTGQNWVLESGLIRTLGQVGPIAPSFSAVLGSSYGDEDKGGIDYYYWNAGFSFVFADYFEFDLRYFDTFDVPTGTPDLANCNNKCDGRVVARITFEN